MLSLRGLHNMYASNRTPQMLFGILEVFGITDISGNMRIRSDEICKAIECRICCCVDNVHIGT